MVVDSFPGARQTALYIEAASDGRPIFILPWLGRYLIGTTDIRYDGDVDDVRASEEEIGYLLAEVNRVLPMAKLTHNSVLYVYSGVRPLPFTEAGEAAGITRRHNICDHSPGFDGLLSIVGGKLTTYRSLAEEAVDAICKRLGKTRFTSANK